MKNRKIYRKPEHKKNIKTKKPTKKYNRKLYKKTQISEIPIQININERINISKNDKTFDKPFDKSFVKLSIYEIYLLTKTSLALFVGAAIIKSDKLSSLSQEFELTNILISLIFSNICDIKQLTIVEIIIVVLPVPALPLINNLLKGICSKINLLTCSMQSNCSLFGIKGLFRIDIL